MLAAEMQIRWREDEEYQPLSEAKTNRRESLHGVGTALMSAYDPKRTSRSPISTCGVRVISADRRCISLGPGDLDQQFSQPLMLSIPTKPRMPASQDLNCRKRQSYIEDP